MTSVKLVTLTKADEQQGFDVPKYGGGSAWGERHDKGITVNQVGANPHLEGPLGLALGAGADLDLCLRVLEERPQGVATLGAVVLHLQLASKTDVQWDMINELSTMINRI